MSTDAVFDTDLISKSDVTYKGRPFTTTVEYTWLGPKPYVLIHQESNDGGDVDTVIISKEEFLELANTVRGH